jgi:mycothiol synthase
VAQLIYQTCEADGDTSVALSPEELASSWKLEGFTPEQDAFLVETRQGLTVGYAELVNVSDHCELNGDLYVHPHYKAAGIGKALLEAIEARAGEQLPLAAPDQRISIRFTFDNQDETSKAVFAQAGYAAVRYYWRMGIDLQAAPAAPHLPPGFEIRPFVQEQHAQAVWQASNEAFEDNWGSHPLTFDEFSYRIFEAPGYDPRLWCVIWDGKELAGFSINHYRMGIGWIHILGVRPAWRTKGLGLALLHHSFGEFYQRGTKTIGLGVDAANATGATRLYQKAGMHTVSEFVSYEKVLRAGKP